MHSNVISCKLQVVKQTVKIIQHENCQEEGQVSDTLNESNHIKPREDKKKS